MSDDASEEMEGTEGIEVGMKEMIAGLADGSLEGFDGALGVGLAADSGAFWDSVGGCWGMSGASRFIIGSCWSRRPERMRAAMFTV